MSIERWEHFNHSADIGVRGFGGDKSEAFVQVALALISVITDISCVASDHSIKIKCNVLTYTIFICFIVK